jgi:predicted protein tyrosine phosphatase
MSSIKILTVCKQGLVRSVGLADVLKMHFTPVDVIPIGYRSNSTETKIQLMTQWADHIIAMEQVFYEFLCNDLQATGLGQAVLVPQIHLCDVGVDRYHNSRHRELIDQVWDWVRKNQTKLEIEEHFEKV